MGLWDIWDIQFVSIAAGARNAEERQRYDLSLPIDLGPETDRVFLILFGTGIRFQTTVSATVGGADSRVDYAGEQGDFAGLDQVNLLLPRSLMGDGETDVMLMADGEASNTVKVNIR